MSNPEYNPEDDVVLNEEALIAEEFERSGDFTRPFVERDDDE